MMPILPTLYSQIFPSLFTPYGVSKYEIRYKWVDNIDILELKKLNDYDNCDILSWRENLHLHLRYLKNVQIRQ